MTNNWVKETKRQTWRDVGNKIVLNVQEYCSNCTLVGFAYIANSQ